VYKRQLLMMQQAVLMAIMMQKNYLEEITLSPLYIVH